MVWVERDLRGSSSPTTLSKQGCLEQVAQELVKVGFEYFQRRRLQNLSGKPVPVLHHPQSEEFLPHVQLELPVIQFLPAGKDFGASPEEEVTHAEKAPLHNKMPENEQQYALFMDGSCHIVGKQQRWRAGACSLI